MKKILLLQFRDDVSKEHEIKCFLNKLSLEKSELVVINTIIDEIYDEPKEMLTDIGAVILGGSGQYDLSLNQTPVLNALKKIDNLLGYILKNDFPTLGICFGHQLICQRLGEVVAPNQDMRETGTVEINLTEAGKKSPLFDGVKTPFLVQQGHKESVLNLPNDMVLLGSSEKCLIQACRYKKNIYTTQFHPELSKDDIKFRFSLFPTYMQGRSIEEVTKNIKETPDAEKILENFANLYLS